MMLLPQEELKLKKSWCFTVYQQPKSPQRSVLCFIVILILHLPTCNFFFRWFSSLGFFQGAFIFPVKVFFCVCFLFVFPFECGPVKPFRIVVMSQLRQTVDTNEEKVED